MEKVKEQNSVFIKAGKENIGRIIMRFPLGTKTLKYLSQ